MFGSLWASLWGSLWRGLWLSQRVTGERTVLTDSEGNVLTLEDDTIFTR